LRTIRLDDGPATSLALSGSRALTGHANGNVVLWDFERADRLGVYKRNDAEVWAVTFLGRPDRFAAASHDWKVALWDAASPGAPAHVLEAHQNSVQAATFAMTPNGPMLATGGADKTVRLWNIDTIEKVRRYSGHRDFVTTLAFSPDFRALASAGLDGSIRLWSTRSHSTLRRLYGHRGRVGGLAFSPQSDTLVSAGEDGKVRVWDLKRGRAARVLPGTFAPQRAVSVSPDGQRIAAAGDDGTIRVWANPLAKSLTN
jgi:WD40 repeat protein